MLILVLYYSVTSTHTHTPLFYHVSQQHTNELDVADSDNAMDMDIDSVNDNGTESHDTDMNTMMDVDTSTMETCAMTGSKGEFHVIIVKCYALSNVVTAIA
jgi:hypothetical protein